MMKRVKTSLISLLTGVVLLECGNALAASVNIDTFSAAGARVFVGETAFDPAPLQVQFLQRPTGSPATSIVGGYRDLFLTNAAGNTDEQSASGLVSTVNGNLTYSNQVAISSQFEITWDGNDNSPSVATTGLGGVNLLSTGNDAVGILFQSADQSLSATLKIWDMNNNLSQATFVFGAALTNQTVNFAYTQSAFNLISGNKALLSTGANFTNVGAIQLILTGDPSTLTALDASVDILESRDIVNEVPEPSAVVSLLGLSLLGIFFIKRK